MNMSEDVDLLARLSVMEPLRQYLGALGFELNYLKLPF
jgi:hypothetical protein